MLIGIYTDAHFSKSSSIFNQVTGYKYSARLDMLIDSFKWMYKEFSNAKVDLIVNCGDLLDSTVIDAKTNSALSEALSYNTGIPEIHLLGNHEKDTKDGVSNSVSLLNGFSNIEVYTTPTKISNEISVFPYMMSADAEEFDLESVKSKILFSHLNYYGMHLGQYMIEEGISTKYASSIFDLVLNGHIHSRGSYENNKVINIGSMVGHGFGDTYSSNNLLPGIMILDTSNLSHIIIPNPYSVLFFNYKVSSVSELSDKLSKLEVSPTNKICLKVTVPYEIRNDVSTYVSSLDYISVSRVVSTISKLSVTNNLDNLNELMSDDIVKIDSDESSVESLKSYIDSVDDSKLPAPKDRFMKFIDNYL